MAASFGALSLLKYAYCAAALLLTVIGMAYTTGTMPIKAVVTVIAAAIVLYSGSVNGFMFLAAAVPAIAALAAAKSEHAEWYIA
jgi:hypothetical protein